MTFAPPVSRDNFYYNGELYVEVGNSNRHKRASVDEISAILRPDLKKSSKGLPDPSLKDQVGHWYEAQLIHYGLPPSKDKSRAKMRLLEALNASTLSVPANISKMEGEMKKEYAAAERKAKADYKALQGPAKKAGSLEAGKKRKQSDISSNINNVDSHVSLGKGAQRHTESSKDMDTHQAAKKVKTKSSGPKEKEVKKKNADLESSKPSKKTTKPKAEEPSSEAQTTNKRPRQTAKCPRLTQAWMADPTMGPGPINIATGQRYYRTVSGDLILGDVGQPPPNTIQPATQKKPSVKKESVGKIQPRVKQESNAKGEPQSGKAPGVAKGAKAKKEVKVKKESPSASSSSLGLINGIYDISCPTVEGEWSCQELTLTLALSGTTIWGAYDLGMFSGVLFVPSRPWQPSPEPLPFTWRGRENGEGEMRFGNGCDGEISFLGNGVVEGWISVYGHCKFRGVRRPEAGTNVVSVGDLREEWDGYNEEAYEEERTGRWG